MHIIVKNFSHPITDAQKTELVDLIDNVESIKIVDYTYQVDFNDDIVAQSLNVFQAAFEDCNAVDGMLMCGNAYVLVRPPALTEGTILVTLYVYQKFGIFPVIPAFKTIRSVPPRYSIYRIIDLNTL